MQFLSWVRLRGSPATPRGGSRFGSWGDHREGGAALTKRCKCAAPSELVHGSVGPAPDDVNPRYKERKCVRLPYRRNARVSTWVRQVDNSPSAYGHAPAF